MICNASKPNNELIWYLKGQIFIKNIVRADDLNKSLIYKF